MKVIVIGLGSMGKRRIRLIKQIDSKAIIIGVDDREDRRKEAEELYGIKTKINIKTAVESDSEIKYAVISTSPLSHAEIINECLRFNLNVFTELNLVSDRYDENISLAESKNLVLFLSSTFLYRDEIKYIRNRVLNTKSKTNYNYHIGQYLPDWHPWENYKSFFVGNKRTNGCREIMSIDLPWIIKTFGEIKNMHVSGGNISSLEVNYPDNYQLILEHENGNKGVITVDIVCRKAVRNLEVYGENIFLSWDGSALGLRDYNIETKEDKIIDLYSEIDHQDGYSAFVVENAYKNELLSFFNQVEKSEGQIYDFRDDKRTLEIIDTIERKVF